MELYRARAYQRWLGREVFYGPTDFNEAARVACSWWSDPHGRWSMVRLDVSLNEGATWQKDTRHRIRGAVCLY